MKLKLPLLIFTALLAACSKQSEAPAPIASGPTLEACALLTNEEIASVLGEEMKETKKLVETERGFHVSMCLFVMPTAANSLTLRLVQRAVGPDARDPRQVWNESFAPEKLQAQVAAGGGQPTMPERVPNVGDEAYWRGHTKGGALYVLKSNAYLRISIVQSGDKEATIQKCSALAQIALKRL